jgi:hypothetical protein
MNLIELIFCIFLSLLQWLNNIFLWIYRLVTNKKWVWGRGCSSISLSATAIIAATCANLGLLSINLCNCLVAHTININWAFTQFSSNNALSCKLLKSTKHLDSQEESHQHYFHNFKRNTWTSLNCQICFQGGFMCFVKSIQDAKHMVRYNYENER